MFSFLKLKEEILSRKMKTSNLCEIGKERNCGNLSVPVTRWESHDAEWILTDRHVEKRILCDSRSCGPQGSF